MKKNSLLAATILACAFGAACAPTPEQIVKTGLAPAAAAQKTLTVYSSAGRKIFEDRNPAEEPRSSTDSGKVYVHPEGSTAHTYASSLTGATFETLYYDPAKTKPEAIRAIEDAAPYTVVVLAANNETILTGKFTSVSNSSTYANLYLKAADGTTVRQLDVYGLQVIASQNKDAFAPDALTVKGGLNTRPTLQPQTRPSQEPKP